MMKSLVLTEYKKLEVKDMPVPEVGPGDVRVKVDSCGICGSDVHGYDGSSGRRIPPLIMGHEAAGVVEAVGEGVEDLGPGDRVTFDGWYGEVSHIGLRSVKLITLDDTQIFASSDATFDYAFDLAGDRSQAIKTQIAFA